MPRLSDLPEPYAIVVMLPSTPPVTATVNGRAARMIAWLLDHRPQIEQIRGSVWFNFGDRGFQAELRETFPYENVQASVTHGGRATERPINEYGMSLAEIEKDEQRP